MAQVKIEPSVRAKNTIAVRFDKMTRAARKGGSAEALKQAENIADEMRSLAPVLTGAMKADIAVKTRVNNNREIVLSVGPHNTHYAKFVEFGTVNMSANPFMRVSIELHRRDVQQALTNAVRTGVKGAL